MAASIVYAADFIEREHHLNLQDLGSAIFDVRGRVDGPPDVVVWIPDGPNSSRWHAIGTAVPAAVAKPAAMPWNAEPFPGKALIEGPLLAEDALPMIAVLRGWPSYLAKRGSSAAQAPLNGFVVLVQPQVFLGKTEMGIGLTPLHFVHFTLSCDFSAVVEPDTFAVRWLAPIC